VADEGLLAVSDRLDGAGAAVCHLPGALHAVPGAARPGGHRGPQGLGLRRRRRDGRAGVAGGPEHRRARGARQPGVRRQLQPAAARRPGTRQRLDHPGAGGPVCRRRLERHQAAVGLGLGPAVCARHPPVTAARAARDGRRRVPDPGGHRRALQPRALLRQEPRAAAARVAPVRRRHRPAAPRRPRPGEDLFGLLARQPPPRPAHGDPGQDQEGLRHGQRRPGPHDHAPAEKARRAAAHAVSRPLRPAAVGRAGAGLRVRAPGGRQPRDGALRCRPTARR